MSLQIYDITEKDLKDVCLVILAHDIGDSDQETINIDHIIRSFPLNGDSTIL